MENQSSVEPGIVVVDVANVCRDGSLPGSVSLTRLKLVLEAWEFQIARHVEVHLVADASLLKELPRPERDQAKKMKRRRELSVKRRGADDLLLDTAEELGACVLSRERFLDKRRGREWVDARFYSWIEEDGFIRIWPRPSRNTQSFDISRKEEQKLARSLGFLDLRHPAARRRWVCVSEVPCATRAATPEYLQALPLLRGSVALCPGCHQPLHNDGVRPEQAELKLVVDKTELARFTLTQGKQIAFGRAMMPNSPKLAQLGWKGTFADVGRIHADLRLSESRVAIRPVDEDHLVAIRRWDSSKRRYRRDQRLRASDGFTKVGLRDVIVLGRRLELIRSGRSIAEAHGLGEATEGDKWRVGGTDR